eukprot:6197520-Pleurochrysis_carterae.AAC.7
MKGFQAKLSAKNVEQGLVVDLHAEEDGALCSAARALIAAWTALMVLNILSDECLDPCCSSGYLSDSSQPSLGTWSLGTWSLGTCCVAWKLVASSACRRVSCSCQGGGGIAAAFAASLSLTGSGIRGCRANGRADT